MAAQFEALLSDDLWRRNARHANGMARRLADAVAAVPGVRLARPAQANGVFAVLPREAIAPLQARVRFYTWNEAACEVRWMTACDTREEDVDEFAAIIREVVAPHAAP